MASNQAGYNPDDPLQSGFLSALALGETGHSTFAATEGTGGSNLAGAPTDQYGFPQWTGQGNSHAAGTFQFQPSTWASVASTYGLNFQNASDQAEGAWYYAEQVFSQHTGGQSLESALQSGDYSTVQHALTGVWPSVAGNQANPQGLSAILPSYLSGASTATAPAPSATATGTDATPSTQAAGGPTGIGFVDNLIGGTENLFERGGLIVIGAIIIAVAAWAILAQQGVVPTPRQIVKDI